MTVSKDLIIREISNSPLVKKEYKEMLTNIQSTLPAIRKTSSNFYKSHSQFMGVMLDVTASHFSKSELLNGAGLWTKESKDKAKNNNYIQLNITNY